MGPIYCRDVAHPPGECAGVECMVDAGTQFCEQCGRDRDSFASARNTYRDCPSCGAACCADCWNLVDKACLACAPFRLTGATTRPRIVIAADLPPTTALVDRYADLRSDPGTLPTDVGATSRGPARERLRDVAPGGRAPAALASRGVTAPIPNDLGSGGRTGFSGGATGFSGGEPRRQRRRAGRVGLAASVAWVVVGALAVVVLGASPARQVPVPDAVLPVASSSFAPRAATPSPVVSAAPSARPTRAPRATATPRGGGGTGGAGGGTRGAPRATPRPTPRPAGPVVVAPPTPAPAPTPSTAPEPEPTATAESTPATDEP